MLRCITSQSPCVPYCHLPAPTGSSHDCFVRLPSALHPVVLLCRTVPLALPPSSVWYASGCVPFLSLCLAKAFLVVQCTTLFPGSPCGNRPRWARDSSQVSLQRQAYSGQHDTPDDKTKQLEFQEDGAREHAQHNGGLHHTIQGLAEADEAQPNRLRTGQAGQPDATTARHIPNRSAP